MRGPLPAPEGRDRGSDAEQHGTSRAGGRASAEGAASRRVASDFGAVWAGTRLHGQTPAGGRRRRQESHGCLRRVRAELATPCPHCPSLHAGGAGLAVGLRRDRPAPWARTSLLTPAVRTGSAPPHQLAARVHREATRGPAAPTCLASRPHALCFSRTVLEATCSECARARGCDTASRRCPS